MNSALAPRQVCWRCRRPAAVCFCELAPQLATRTRVLLLQHPRESRMPVGTARLAHLGLAGSQLRVGCDFAQDPVVAAALAQQPPPYVLFPGDDAIDVHTLVGEGRTPITLIALDGTWTQAKKLLRLNPRLAALPRLSFPPTRTSDYRIRKQPADFCVSTIEALGQVLQVLEPEGFASERLLDPFTAMVDRQQRYADEVHASRHRGGRKALLRREPRGVTRLRALAARLVCIHGEVNAWPLRHPAWQPAEVVQWLAHRPATGEHLEIIVRPQRPFAPGLCRHIEIEEDVLQAGESAAGWRARAAGFLRPDDVLIGWGDFPRALALRDGALPPELPFIDLRIETAQWLHRKAGPVDGVAALLGAEARPNVGLGRGGRRLGNLLGVLGLVTGSGGFMPR
ncbi:MAG TPA: tRNA-uridine aminocarboxypropyltransferase [Polyangia bacterium]